MLSTRMGIFLSSLVLSLMILPVAGVSASTTGPCNEETAAALGEEYDLNPFAPIVKTMSPLCGEFLEPGVEAMIARAIPATCGGYAGWGAFRREADGSWQLVWKERNGQLDLQPVGNDLEETLGILGPHDARCVGKKATKTRLWHWDGQQFVHGPWTVHLLGTAPSFIAQWRRVGISCMMADDPNIRKIPGNYHNGVSCISGKSVRKRAYRQRAQLLPNGRVRVCQKYGSSSCLGSYFGCAEDFTKVHTGELVVVGRFTCTILQRSVQCTNTASRGFVISPSKIRRLR